MACLRGRGRGGGVAICCIFGKRVDCPSAVVPRAVPLLLSCLSSYLADKVECLGKREGRGGYTMHYSCVWWMRYLFLVLVLVLEHALVLVLVLGRVVVVLRRVVLVVIVSVPVLVLVLVLDHAVVAVVLIFLAVLAVQVAAALHPIPSFESSRAQGRQQQHEHQHDPLSGAWELSADLLPQFSRYEMLREAKLQDQARCEQSEVGSGCWVELGWVGLV